jgi:HlyD family secretion protein
VAAVKKLLFLLLLIAASLATASYWIVRSREPASEADQYTLAPAEYGRIAEVVSATGLVQAKDVYPVGTELAGKVVEVLADFNQVVKEGEVLLRLDDRVARQRLKQAEVAVELARVSVKQAEANRDAAATALQRVRELSPEVRRQTDIDVAESQLRVAETGCEAARVRVRESEEARRQAELGLKLHTVRAPVLGPESYRGSASLPVTGGVGAVTADSAPPDEPDRRTFTVLDRHVSLNEEVAPPTSGRLFELAGSMERMQVQVQVVEGDINKIQRGMEADFTVPGRDGDIAFKGNVDEVRQVPGSDRGAVYYKVIVDVRNARDRDSGEWQLRPGLTASVDFVRRARDATWKIPSAALRFQPEAATLSDAARARLAELPNARWKAIWVVGADKRPWPVFVRVAEDAGGEPAIQDAQTSEVLEWEPALRPEPVAGQPNTYPKLIIAAPPARKQGLFSAPRVKF